MKKIYLILLVIALFGGLGAVVFLVTKKKKDSKKNSPKVPVIAPGESAAIIKKETEALPSIPQKPLVKESLGMDIKVPYVEVGNRRFDYSMHYKGIPYKGTFEDGVTSTVHVKKSFGSFVIKQRMNRERGSYDAPVGRNTAKDQKIRGGTANVSTKGGAAIGSTGTVTSVSMASAVPIGKGISGITSLKSDWVDLAILDSNNSILKQLSINLRTGETISNAKLPKD
jgi:hypothetical protein